MQELCTICNAPMQDMRDGTSSTQCTGCGNVVVRNIPKAMGHPFPQQPISCVRCGSGQVAVARDAYATKVCHSCGHSWNSMSQQPSNPQPPRDPRNFRERPKYHMPSDDAPLPFQDAPPQVTGKIEDRKSYIPCGNGKYCSLGFNYAIEE